MVWCGEGGRGGVVRGKRGRGGVVRGKRRGGEGEEEGW